MSESPYIQPGGRQDPQTAELKKIAEILTRIELALLQLPAHIAQDIRVMTAKK